tara:strand:+ start:20155 stop:20430 length:276 start_codon:yes stop_codon:yes gene_type:complete
LVFLFFGECGDGIQKPKIDDSKEYWTELSLSGFRQIMQHENTMTAPLKINCTPNLEYEEMNSVVRNSEDSPWSELVELVCSSGRGVITVVP